MKINNVEGLYFICAGFAFASLLSAYVTDLALSKGQTFWTIAFGLTTWLCLATTVLISRDIIHRDKEES